MKGSKSGPPLAAAFSLALRLFDAGGVFAQRGGRGPLLAHVFTRNTLQIVCLATGVTWCAGPYRANVCHPFQKKKTQ